MTARESLNVGRDRSRAVRPLGLHSPVRAFTAACRAGLKGSGPSASKVSEGQIDERRRVLETEADSAASVRVTLATQSRIALSATMADDGQSRRTSARSPPFPVAHFKIASAGTKNGARYQYRLRKYVRLNFFFHASAADSPLGAGAPMVWSRW